MSKRRVHEIAKELKDKHGIEFDNKQVVEELNRLGYDVKTHSSSLEDEEAASAVRKIVEERKPKTAPPPVAPKGFVVRRKVGDNVVATQVAVPTGPIAPPNSANSSTNSDVTPWTIPWTFAPRWCSPSLRKTPGQTERLCSTPAPPYPTPLWTRQSAATWWNWRSWGPT